MEPDCKPERRDVVTQRHVLGIRQYRHCSPRAQLGVLSRISAGENITVQIIRGGERVEMPLTLGEPPTR